MSANQKRFYMAKVIFHYRDFVAGTKNRGIPVFFKNSKIIFSGLNRFSNRLQNRLI
jgi:hypothetical protein